MSIFNSDPLFRGGYGIGANMQAGFDRARGNIEQGSLMASDYLRQGYEDLFRARAQGAIGGFGEMQSRMGAQAASQGLSPDVLQRLMLAPGMELQAGLGAQLGEAQSGLGFDLAKLWKGTAGELAGLDEAQIAAWVNKEVAKRAAKGAKMGGLISAGGAILGGALGGPMGGMLGAQLGGAASGGGGYGPMFGESYGDYHGYS